MKLILSLLVITISIQTQAADKDILNFKSWKATEVESHKVSGKGACVAATKELGDGDTSLEVYSESNGVDGFVNPVVQIVTTSMDPALGVMASVDGRDMPMSISLSETKEIEVEVLEEGSSIPVVKKVEQQVFLGKFNEKTRMISLLKNLNKVKATFYSADGEVGKAEFSLSGSSRTIGTMLETCQ